ncbi:MAG: ATP-binding protein [Clostridiales Family XIII bacterium]|jgi:serine/threonine-protein kinase RsbW|nr:ATP-binding protein [Clostridiales Family XIII bacterium]
MSDLMKMSVPGKPEYVATVRMAAASVASHAGFDIEAIEDIKVAVSEACNNTVVHAGEANLEEYNVEFVREEEGLTITVSDAGPGYDTDSYEEPNISELNSGGLGIFIIRALMDEVDITSGPGLGTNIRMTKYLAKDIA